MYYIIDIAKALACLLIANFHSDILFPDNLSILAFGGDIGNNIFFIVSGFTLLPSVEKCFFRDIGKWYLKRLVRLLPMLLFFYLLTWLTGGVIIQNFNDAVKAFIFPTMYWFTGAIIFFYFIFFVIEKYIAITVRCIGIVLLLLLHLYLDNISAERYFIGFIAMLSGAWIRRNFSQLTTKVKCKRIVPLIIVIGILYVILKLLRSRGIEILGFVHLSIGTLTICLAMEILLWGGAYEYILQDFFESRPRIYRLIKKLSESTMAVYLLMGLNNRMIMCAIKEHIAFPASYIVNIVFSLVCAYAITFADKKLHNLMK